MINLLKSTKGLYTLQDNALAHVADQMVREASIISSQLHTKVYIYNFLGNREVKDRSYIEYTGERVNYLRMSDNRIAVEGTICVGNILTKEQALSWFEYFIEEMDLPIRKDETGISYNERKCVPYHYIKDNLCYLGDKSSWSHYDWKNYFCFWNRCRIIRRSKIPDSSK
jgi:hypothetical protein